MWQSHKATKDKMTTLKHRIGKYILPIIPVDRRTFDMLRREINSVTLQTRNSLSLRYHIRKHKLSRSTELSVNFGSGGRGLANWINTDVGYHADTYIRIDIRRPLPFSAGSVKRAFAEHVLEHIDFRHDVPKFLRNVYQILQPTGVIRIIVPDGERFIEAYVMNDKEKWRELGWDLNRMPNDIYTPMHIVNHVFHQEGEHKFAYDFATLKYVLERAGFQQVLKQQFKVSVDRELAIDQENHRPYSLYVEAIK
jgi:predicted SAM-dependent methyltransferase